MTFDPATVKLMAEFFADKLCVICGNSAQRFRSNYKDRGPKFYCLDHAPRVKRDSRLELRETKDHYRGRR